MAIELSVGALAETVSAALPLTPLIVALIVADPAATAVASPPVLTVATDVLDDAHVADEVTSAVDPSLYVPVAVNCCVAPTPMLAVVGAALIETSALFGGVTPGEEPQPTPAMTSRREEKRTRQKSRHER